MLELLEHFRPYKAVVDDAGRKPLATTIGKKQTTPVGSVCSWLTLFS